MFLVGVGYCLLFDPSLYYLLPFLVESDDISEEAEETIDQVAVLTSNALFFIVMFIFAVFETYVFHYRKLRQSCLNNKDAASLYSVI